MLRSILAFAVLAVVAWIGFSILMGLLGGLLGLALKVLWLAAIGFLFFLVIRILSPSTAERIREVIKGRRA